MLAFRITSYAQEFDCSSSVAYPVDVAGYLKNNNSHRNVTKTVFTIVNPDPSQESTYLKAFDIGKYRFIKNNASKNGWDVYRINATSKAFELLKDYEEPIRVFENESVVVSMRSPDSLFIRRLSVVSDKQKEMMILTNREKITVKSLDQDPFDRHYPLDKCINAKAPARGASAAKDVKDGQAKP